MVVQSPRTGPERSSRPTPNGRVMPDVEPDRWPSRRAAGPLAALAGLTVLLGPYVLGTRADYPALFWTAVTVVGFFGSWTWWRFRGPGRPLVG